jgi:assimilatory nitrate reductase catalytic subunit
VRTDLEILHALADRLGRGELFPTDPADVYAELRRASAGGTADYAGISYARLAAGEQLFWPCPDESHPGTPRMFLDAFPTPDGRARFVAVRPRAAADRPDEEYPYLLTTGRSRSHYQSGTQTRRSPTLHAAVPEAYAELHPELADALGVADGDLVRLRTPRGNAVFRTRFTPGIRRDTVFVPFHWGGESRVNVLVSDALDPISRMPEFKTCPVAVEPATTPEDRAAQRSAAHLPA